MRKPTICICENKDADQLRGNSEADQRLCFRYIDSTLPLLLKSKISSFQPDSVAAQTGLCRTCSETTLLVFPRDGSILHPLSKAYSGIHSKPIVMIMNFRCDWPFSILTQIKTPHSTIRDNNRKKTISIWNIISSN